MSIRTTLTLDEDVAARLKEECKKRGVSFRALLNEAVRAGLRALNTQQERTPFEVQTFHMGTYPGLNYDDISGLLDYAEGDFRR